MYELRHVHKRYGLAKVALRKVDLVVSDREFLVLYGPAGAGKSTLLNILAGITRPTSGDVLRDGISVLGVPPEKRDAAMAFENYALYSHLSVGENLAFPLRARGMARAEIDARVKRFSDILGIGHLLDRRPGFLSGGQRQRVRSGGRSSARRHLSPRRAGRPPRRQAPPPHPRRAQGAWPRTCAPPSCSQPPRRARRSRLATGSRSSTMGGSSRSARPPTLSPAGKRVRRLVRRRPADELHHRRAAPRGRRFAFVTAGGMPVAALRPESVAGASPTTALPIQVGFRSNEVRLARAGEPGALRGPST